MHCSVVGHCTQLLCCSGCGHTPEVLWQCPQPAATEPCANGGVTQNQMVPPWLSLPGTGIPLIPRSAEIRGAQRGCDFPFFPASVHPHSKFPCENCFEASQEMARSSSGPENFGCLWVCLYNKGTSTVLEEKRIPSMTNCCQSLLSSHGPVPGDRTTIII